MIHESDIRRLVAALRYAAEGERLSASITPSGTAEYAAHVTKADAYEAIAKMIDESILG